MPGNFTLITGASSDIGAGIALSLCRKKRLILHGRNDARLKSVLNMLDNKDSHMIWPYDLSDIGRLQENFAAYLGKESKVEAFVHVAGMTYPAPLRLIGEDLLENYFRVNFYSAALILSLLTKKLNRPYLKNVVFISSVGAHFGGKGTSVYSASKAALEGFARGAAIELAPDVRVNIIVPGKVKINLDTPEEKAYIEAAAYTHPLGLGEPRDIADAVSFLMSDKSKWITGQCLTVDGGYSINSIKG